MKKNSSLVLQHIIWRGLYFFSILILNIGIARFFAAEKSGQIFYIVNNLALVLLIASISLESGSTYYIAGGELEVSLMAQFCLVWATGASLVALVGWWAVLFFTHSVLLSDPEFLTASFFYILGVLFTNYFTALFYAKKEFALPNKIIFGVNLVLILFLILERNNLALKAHFIEIYFFCFFLQGILLRVFFSRKFPYRGQSMFPSNPILIKVIRYSLAALTANLIYFLVNRVDYWFVQYFCSAKDLGNYIQASKLAQMMLILPAILGSTLFPIFSSGEKSGNEPELSAVIRVLFWINGGISVIIVCLGWFVFPFVFGVSFNKMYLLFVLLIPGILCITMNYPMAAWFSAARKISINIRGSILSLTIICVGDLIALPHYGILVAPVISSVGYFCFYCYTVYMYRKEYVIPWKDFLIIRKSDLNRILQTIRNKNQDLSPDISIVQNSLP
jgi:O-antigen/teichoic acid export membrane protein